MLKIIITHGEEEEKKEKIMVKLIMFLPSILSLFLYSTIWPNGSIATRTPANDHRMFIAIS
jgi:hypothetical protein